MRLFIHGLCDGWNESEKRVSLELISEVKGQKSLIGENNIIKHLATMQIYFVTNSPLGRYSWNTRERSHHGPRAGIRVGFIGTIQGTIAVAIVHHFLGYFMSSLAPPSSAFQVGIHNRRGQHHHGSDGH